MDEPTMSDMVGPDPQRPQSPPPAPKQRRASTRAASLIAMVVVGLALVLGLAFLGSSQTDDEEPSEPAVAATIPEDSSTAPPETSTPPVDTIGPPNEIDTTGTDLSRPRVSDDVERSTLVADSFTEEINRNGASYGIAYATDAGVVVLDAQGITEPEVEIAQRFQHVSEFAMLTGEGRTWAIDADDRSQSYLVSNMYVVVEAERSGTIAVIDEENGTIGILSAGLPIPSIEVPDDAELLTIQERGVLVIPSTGETLELSGTASSLVQLSTARAVSANTGATVYEDCSAGETCAYTVVTQDPATSNPLRIPPGSAVDVSPTGRWVVVRLNGQTSLIDVESGTETDLGQVETSAVSWAPSGEFVALARGGSIDVVLPEESRAITLDVNETADLIALVSFVS